MIIGVILHLANDLPVLVDLERMPEPGDRMIVCTNVRTIDGKRPSFVSDRNGTFIFPLEVIRLMEAPPQADRALSPEPDKGEPEQAAEPDAGMDEEPDEDLLARIRDI
jgi:hypothetical protein